MALGQTQLASNIMALSTVFEIQSGGAATFVTDKAIEGVDTMCIVSVNMNAGVNIGTGGDVDGQLNIGGKTVMDMNDGSNKMLETYMQALTMFGFNVKEIPIFQNSNGEIAFFDGTALRKINFTTYSLEYADASFFTGDYVSLYFMGLCATLEYYN